MKTLAKNLIVIIFAILSINVYAINVPSGFLTKQQTINSLDLLPPPPQEGSKDFLADQGKYEQTRSLEGSARWQQAITDAEIDSQNIGKPFSQAFGVDISPQNTPITYELLSKVYADAGYLATLSAKEHYMRTRPFVFYSTSTCLPKDEPFLRKDGSYPSGHTALGWATALVLAEINPQHGQEIIKRGYEFGQSRVVCRAHWQSDVDAGRTIGAAVVSLLHANPQFIEELKKAKAEINAKIQYSVN